jgi:hypothetical protein
MAKKRKKEVMKKTAAEPEKKIEVEAEKNSEKSKKAIWEKQNKQIMWAGILMISVILIVVLVPFIRQNYINKFVYANLDFQKTKLGDILFYSTRIPITDKQGQIIGSYSTNFRKDPRKLENIPVNLTKGVVAFRKDNTVYISLNPLMESCPDNTLAFINLAGFLRDFAGLNIKSAVSDKKYGQENNILYANCQSAKNNTVIFITSGNETKITQTFDNCYELSYKNCEVLNVSEKFMIEIIDNYMSYFVKKK